MSPDLIAALEAELATAERERDEAAAALDAAEDRVNELEAALEEARGNALESLPPHSAGAAHVS